MITLHVRSGSIIVDATITPPSLTIGEDAFVVLSVQTPASLSAVVGMHVVSINEPQLRISGAPGVPPSAPQPPPPSPPALRPPEPRADLPPSSASPPATPDPLPGSVADVILWIQTPFGLSLLVGGTLLLLLCLVIGCFCGACCWHQHDDERDGDVGDENGDVNDYSRRQPHHPDGQRRRHSSIVELSIAKIRQHMPAPPAPPMTRSRSSFTRLENGDVKLEPRITMASQRC